MYIRKTTKSHKGKSYINYLLVESVYTPKGPRQRIICSLGSLAPAPLEQWRDLAHRLEASLQGQSSFTPADPQVAALAEKAHRAEKPRLRLPAVRWRWIPTASRWKKPVRRAPSMSATRCGSGWG